MGSLAYLAIVAVLSALIAQAANPSCDRTFGGVFCNYIVGGKSGNDAAHFHFGDVGQGNFLVNTQLLIDGSWTKCPYEPYTISNTTGAITFLDAHKAGNCLNGLMGGFPWKMTWKCSGQNDRIDIQGYNSYPGMPRSFNVTQPCLIMK